MNMRLIRDTLAILVMDLGYTVQIPPIPGIHPIRHCRAWAEAHAVLTPDEFSAAVVGFQEQVVREEGIQA